MEPLTIIIILLIIQIIQADARIYQVTRELKQLRKDMANKA
ncbi:MAG TPA: hypothetical protein VF585_09930 [Chthoniobacterales bacterium]|jgi:cell division protein FtsL